MMAASRISKQDGAFTRTTRIKQFTFVLAASAIIGLLLPMATYADMVGQGTLTLDDGLDAAGDWGLAATNTTFTWSVEKTGGILIYTYTFTTASGGGIAAVSHFDLQVSAGPTRFSFSNPLDFINIDDYTLDDEHKIYDIEKGEGQTSYADHFLNLIDGSVGIRFDNAFITQTEDGVKETTIVIESLRLPMEGYWFAKGGSDDTAWNTSSGTTLVPDTSYVPLPGAALLGMLGLGAAGLKLRRKV